MAAKKSYEAKEISIKCTILIPYKDRKELYLQDVRFGAARLGSDAISDS